MPATAAPPTGNETRELNLTRVFDAPRDIVWRAWTDAKHVSMWWGPHNFSNPVCEIDPKPGGTFRIHMQAPDGTIYPSDGTFREFVPPERLSFTTGLNGMFEILVSVRFTETAPGRTTVDLNARVLHAEGPADQYLAGMRDGWLQSLDKLAEVATPTAEREIIATRLFRAPRELVFSMWSDPRHVAKWWGPKGFTNTIETMEFRAGGEWRFVMHGPDGRNYDNRITYIEIVAPERIVYTHDSTPPFRATVHFAEHEPGVTRLSMHMLFETVELRDNTARTFGAVEGLHQTLGRLEEEMNAMSDKPFVISRTFDAPRDLVWKAWTENERMAQWFGPKGVTIAKSENDLRPGGTYHYGMQTPDGHVIWGRWVYREVTPPERLVFVSSFSDENGGVVRARFNDKWPLETLSTISFEENGGKTTVTVQWEALNANEDERATFSGNHASMLGGWSGTFDQLEAYLASAR